MRYQIRDWAGNMIGNETYPTFDDAWGAIYERFDHLSGAEFDIECDEYHVEEIEI